jgi:chromosome segregation ATPase
VDDTEQTIPLWKMVIDKFLLPLLVLVTSFLAAGIYTMRRDLDRISWDVDHIKTQTEQNGVALERFKAPGDRFTATDGARIDERVRKLEADCERSRETRIEINQRLAQIEKEQEKLCQRIAPCDRANLRTWPTPPP